MIPRMTGLRPMRSAKFASLYPRIRRDAARQIDGDYAQSSATVVTGETGDSQLAAHVMQSGGIVEFAADKQIGVGSDLGAMGIQFEPKVNTRFQRRILRRIRRVQHLYRLQRRSAL